MRKQLLSISLLSVLLFVSCSSPKEFVYLNDMVMGNKYPIDMKHEATIHRDDRLSISVSCKSPELAIPFNLQSGSFRISADGNISAAPETAAISEKGYRVDINGDIDFPILGKLHVEGMSVSEATDLIKNKIIAGNYIKDPLVSIEFLNFKYTVLGAVSRNGNYTVSGDRITLLDAIAQAGDLTSKARIDRVAVIREVGNDRQMFMHDLRSKEIFESPCFYLQQNDIVYVEPKYRKKDSEERGLQYGALIASISTAVTSLLYLLIKK